MIWIHHFNKCFAGLLLLATVSCSKSLAPSGTSAAACHRHLEPHARMWVLSGSVHAPAACTEWSASGRQPTPSRSCSSPQSSAAGRAKQVSATACLSPPWVQGSGRRLLRVCLLRSPRTTKAPPELNALSRNAKHASKCAVISSAGLSFTWASQGGAPSGVPVTQHSLLGALGPRRAPRL